jgi:hypothetical protein
LIPAFTESVVEDAALAGLESLGYTIKHGSDITPAGATSTPALSRGKGRSEAEGEGTGDMACVLRDF